MEFVSKAKTSSSKLDRMHTALSLPQHRDCPHLNLQRPLHSLHQRPHQHMERSERSLQVFTLMWMAVSSCHSQRVTIPPWLPSLSTTAAEASSSWISSSTTAAEASSSWISSSSTAAEASSSWISSSSTAAEASSSTTAAEASSSWPSA
ncbi:hypothetical protein AALO_G00238950 [Alosa alosa]|uniref:Uncharacterized protein n=1 Tax=Alosa alosa TaxID=278164 RepID=A0AAV6FWC2_9TELE|nr:hypothetical protein AALO_G00238950 [Alosa alosa]